MIHWLSLFQIESYIPGSKVNILYAKGEVTRVSSIVFEKVVRVVQAASAVAQRMASQALKTVKNFKA